MTLYFVECNIISRLVSPIQGMLTTAHMGDSVHEGCAVIHNICPVYDQKTKTVACSPFADILCPRRLWREAYTGVSLVWPSQDS